MNEPRSRASAGEEDLTFGGPNPSDRGADVR